LSRVRTLPRPAAMSAKFAFTSDERIVVEGVKLLGMLKTPDPL
jgi:hypothetical protein